MPTYRFDCTQCGHVLEVFLSMSARKRRKCPECGGKLEQRIGGGGGVILKGGGFYNTENRSESYKKAEKKESEQASTKSADKKKGDKGDKKGSKPAAKKKSDKPGGKST